MATPGLVKKLKKIQVDRDEEGNILYPIVINNSLKIQNLGTVDYQRDSYHTEKYIFPIGFQSLRENQSVYVQGERCLFLNEILDGGKRQLFRVTPYYNDVLDHMKCFDAETPSGCWIQIVKEVSEV